MTKKQRKKAGKAKAKAKEKQNEATKQQQKLLEEQIEQLQINDESGGTKNAAAADEIAALEYLFCASCGITKTNEDDGIKLQTCDGCKYVRYCSDACQEKHKEEHKEACEKRAVRDEILFRQPESSHLGDCHICFLPMPLDAKKSTRASCCSKLLCVGCMHADFLRHIKERQEPKCPFCRTKVEDSKEEVKKRLEANDPVALVEKSKDYYKRGEYNRAYEYLSKAAELGDAEAHYYLSDLYMNGLGVEKDVRKIVYHWEEAAILGHPRARYNIGCIERNDGTMERAVKHFIIAANLGHPMTMKVLRNFYAMGDISKEEYAITLRAYQAAVDATKSPQREAAEVWAATATKSP